MAAVCILGPTASGKSALALALAQHLDVEIISVDSAQIYVGMDVGTAKPSLAERGLVAHHLIDICHPSTSYSAARFATEAAQLISAIQNRGRLPLLVGGTMLYVKALREGLDELPSADAAIRQRVSSQARQLGWSQLHRQLARIDPTTAARLAPSDSQRISRALEVYLQTGRAFSSFLRKGASSATAYATAARCDIPILSLEPVQPSGRAALHDRIATRFAHMLQQGLVAEVQAVFQACHENADLPAMRCVGYRQVIDSLQGRAPWSTLVERGNAATRQLAKRQLTWLRAMPRTVLGFEQTPEQLLQQALDWVQLQRRAHPRLGQTT